MTGAPEPVRYLGTCRRCRKAGRPFVRRVDATLTRHRNAAGTIVRYSVQVPGEARERYAADDRFLRISCDACVALDGLHVNAASHYLERVRGSESKHECGAKCLNATGPACECRCRGENHGSGYACVAIGGAS